MPGITNYLNNLNKRLEISSTEISNIELKESFVLNSRRVAADLSSVGAYLNSVIVQSYSELCSKPTFPHDAVVHGLSGMTVKTWPEALGNNKFNSPVFWFGSENPDADGRPSTIKESLQYLWENLNERIIESRENPVDLAPLYDQLSCLDTMLSRLKTDSFGENFILNCLEGYTKQKWPVSKHVYEVLTQLTVGHDIADLAGLNAVAGAYPALQWNLDLNDLLDVDVISSAPVNGDALVYNAEADKWIPEAVSGNVTLDKIEEGTCKVETVDADGQEYVEISTDNMSRWRVTAGGHILPQTTEVYDIGSAGNKVRHLFLSDSSLHLGDHTLKSASGDLIWKETLTVPAYTGTPNGDEILKWNGTNWVPGPESSSGGGTPNSGCFEDSISGGFVVEVAHASGAYNLGLGKSPCMFQFQNKTDVSISIKKFSFVCKEMMSPTINFSFAKCSSAELLTNVFDSASDSKQLTRSNTNPNIDDQGIGLLEDDVSIELTSGQWIVVLLNNYDKTTLPDKDWYCQLMWIA
jgi:hypothetical protein